jgi:RNA polymerase sigma factor (sigma-70 family)
VPDDWLALVLEHREWATRIARYRARRLPAVDPDDAAGEAMLALISAAKRFDPAAGASFRTFADDRIAGAVLDMSSLATQGKRRYRPGLAPKWVDGDIQELAEANKIRAATSPTQETMIELGEAFDAIRDLPPRLAHAARRHWIDDEPLMTIARELDVSESRACQLVKEARKLLVEYVRD